MAVPIWRNLQTWQDRVASFRLAGVALCDIPTQRVENRFYMAGTVLLRRF